MDIDANTARSLAWSSFWSSGTLHSCVGSFGNELSGAIGDFWGRCFNVLEAGDRVIDLATGNGALPLLLSQHASGKNAWTDAVDLAVVSPSWYQPALHPRIRFHSRTSMEKLPFEDATFDLVMSQFGLEYAAWPEALLECARILKPSGRAAFVMHHADSVLVSVARTESFNQALLLEQDGILEAARQVIPWIARASKSGLGVQDELSARDCRLTYNHAIGRLAVEIEKSAVPDLLIEARELAHSWVLSARAGEINTQISLLASYRQSLVEASLRTSELQEHALDQQGIDRLVDTFRGALPSHSSSCQPISHEQGILGWRILVEPTNPNLAFHGGGASKSSVSSNGASSDE